MKAACVAAERGHRVTLVEKNAELGGQLLLNRAIPGRMEMAMVATDLANNLKTLGVCILLGREADVSLVKERRPDVLVVASGAKPIVPALHENDDAKTVQAWDVLAGRKGVGKEVVIVGGNAVGLETALYLASQGTLCAEVLHFLVTNRAEAWETLNELIDRGNKRVTVVEMASKVGQDIGLSTRWTVLGELRRLGVTLMTGTKAVGVTAEGVEIEREGETAILPADSIVFATGSRPENRIAGEVGDLVPEIITIGDAKKPRNALEAIREGFQAGLSI